MNASMHIDGLDRVSVSFATLSQLSDDQIWGMIEPAAETLKTKMTEAILRLFAQHSGSLAGSIEVKREAARSGAVSARVGPNQNSHPHSSQGKRKTRGPHGGGGGRYSGTNAEVGYILNYGSSRIPGRHWLETSCDDAEDEIHAQIEAGFDAACRAAGF